MATQSVKLSIIQFTYDTGKSQIRVLTTQQIAGLKKSKIRKSIIAQHKLAAVEVKIKINNQPL